MFVVHKKNLARHTRFSLGKILGLQNVAVIDFAFNTLNLHRIEADVDTENAGSLALLEKLGFQREGLFRERWFVYGKWQDSVMLGLINRQAIKSKLDSGSRPE